MGRYFTEEEGCDNPKCQSREFHRRRIFSLSHGDWLITRIPIEWLARFLTLIFECDQVHWLLLTKRAGVVFAGYRRCWITPAGCRRIG